MDFWSPNTRFTLPCAAGLLLVRMISTLTCYPTFGRGRDRVQNERTKFLFGTFTVNRPIHLACDMVHICSVALSYPVETISSCLCRPL